MDDEEPAFDAAITAIIDRLGGRSAVATRFGIGLKAVEQWERRGAVPGKWHLALLSWAKELGVSLGPDELTTHSRKAA